MRAPLSLAVAVSIATLSCGPTGPAALRVRVLVDPGVAATCIVLQVNGGAGGEQRQVRGAGAVERDFAVDRGALPDTALVKAGAGVGADCANPLAFSGWTPEQEGTFTTSLSPEADLLLHLSPPAPAADRDGDGFASTAGGGADCDDANPFIHPGAPELCLDGVDADCDGLVGCADPDCSMAPCAPAAARLAFASEPQSLSAGGCSAPVIVQAVTAAGAVAGVPQELPLSLQLTPPGSLRFFADGACTVPMDQARLGPGTLPAQFHVQALTGGDDALQASAAGLLPATQSFAVRPMVMRGTCTLLDWTNHVRCPTPLSFDPAHSVLVFQSTIDDATPNNTDVICSIASGDAVVCDRIQYAGNASISWQVLQRPELTVSHLTTALSGSASNTVPIPQVASIASTFLLTSFDISGTEQGDNDFRYSQLASPTSVVVRSSNGGGGNYTLQVVEWPGSSVTRGVTPPMEGFTLDVTGLAPVDLTRTFLTYGLRTLSGSNAICNRTVRGELISPTAIRFHRGDGNPACLDAMVDAIGWERVQLPAGVRVQPLELPLATGLTTGVAAIAAVDPTRSLLLAGSQYTDGQAGGEGSYALNDVLGDTNGMLTFDGPTQVRVTRAAARGSARWNVFAVEVPP